MEPVAAECGVDPEVLETFFDMFAQTERVMTVYSQGVNQSSTGTDKVNAIINCHLATGRIGRPGTGPFSVTGQPNAMGGREVGGLANQLAAHMRFDDPADRAALQAFWRSPALAPKPGLKAVELFDAVLDGRIKAMWIVATNPAASMPRADRVRAALAACPFVVVSDCWPTDTTALAHVVLPAAGWGEKDGTVTNSERRISRQRAFRAAPGRGAAGLVAVRRSRPPDGLGGGVRLAKLRRRCSASMPRCPAMPMTAGGCSTSAPWRIWTMPASRRCSRSAGRCRPGRPAKAAGCSLRAAFPPRTAARGSCRRGTRNRRGRRSAELLLNTGRVRDQWHTMTRTGLAPSLMSHTPEPMLAMHPADAAAAGIAQGGLTRVVHRGRRGAAARGPAPHPAAWRDLRADALDRPVRLRRPGWARGQRQGGSGLRPAGAEGDAGAVVDRVAVHFHGLLLRRSGGALPRSSATGCGCR